MRDTSEEKAIEDVLEDAMGEAGVILPTNLKQSSRTYWSRSSRTDKKVHSLSTVSYPCLNLP